MFAHFRPFSAVQRQPLVRVHDREGQRHVDGGGEQLHRRELHFKDDGFEEERGLRPILRSHRVGHRDGQRALRGFERGLLRDSKGHGRRRAEEADVEINDHHHPHVRGLPFAEGGLFIAYKNGH